MSAAEQDWDGLRGSWDDYRSAVDAWLEVAPDENAEHAVVDDRIHALIHAHNSWSEKLGAVVEATHHHH